VSLLAKPMPGKNPKFGWMNIPSIKLVDLDVVTKCKRSGQKRGRPKKGEEMVTVYQILARLDINEEFSKRLVISWDGLC